jgi:hypothetical protein
MRKFSLFVPTNLIIDRKASNGYVTTPQKNKKILKTIKNLTIEVLVLEVLEFQDITRKRAYSKFKESVMLVLQNAYRRIFFLFLLICAPLRVYSDNCLQSFGYVDTSINVIEKGMFNQSIIRENDLVDKSRKKICKKHKKLLYYLYTEDFIKSFIEIPTSNVSGDSTTISSKYLAGRASIYNKQDKKVGTCSASFLCMQNENGIYTDISNYLSVDNGLVISWFTPTTLINLELDSIIHSMVTECIVKASTKIGFNPFYGKTFNMIVSSDNEKIYFKLSKI